LLSNGVSSAGEIAEISGVPRSRTYDVLEGLEKAGFVIQKLEDHNISISAQNIVKARPLTYPEMVVATSNAMGVITDSGGLQKEAFLLKTPCVTLRSETEWVETSQYGKNLVVLNPSPSQVNAFINNVNSEDWGTRTPYGSGNAAHNVANELENRGNE
jgi:UDP-N-acetylglucosamine 2-epimerase (non-hydrolysing)